MLRRFAHAIIPLTTKNSNSYQHIFIVAFFRRRYPSHGTTFFSCSASNHGPASSDPTSSTGASVIRAKHPPSPQSTVPTIAALSNSSQVMNPPSKHFIAPAHPQSHHLHTLPPREKTTRTLILDHTAWRQGRTRFAQGRCELGMTVRFKGGERAASTEIPEKRPGFYIASANGLGSRRASDFGDPPEVELVSSDEEGDDGDAKESDGESVHSLRYGKRFKQMDQNSKAHNRTVMDMESDSNSGSDSEVDPSMGGTSSWPQDPSLASSLAARATGIEKVLRAMMAQPPSSPPRSPSPPPYALHSSHANSQHYRPPPSAQPSSPQSSGGPRTVLPNGVRLRLALLALINDLFERQPPPSQQPSSSAIDNGSGSSSKSAPSSIGSPPPLPPLSLPSLNGLPSELAALAQISSQQFYPAPAAPSFQMLPSASSSANAKSTLSPISGTGYGISSTQSGSSIPSQLPTRVTTGAGKDLVEKGQPSAQQSPRPPPPLFSWTRPGTVCVLVVCTCFASDVFVIRRLLLLPPLLYHPLLALPPR